MEKKCPNCKREFDWEEHRYCPNCDEFDVLEWAKNHQGKGDNGGLAERFNLEPEQLDSSMYPKWVQKRLDEDN